MYTVYKYNFAYFMYALPEGIAIAAGARVSPYSFLNSRGAQRFRFQDFGTRKEILKYVYTCF